MLPRRDRHPRRRRDSGDGVSDVVNQFITDYPSHRFVIDYKEAASILNEDHGRDIVRQPTGPERQLEQILLPISRQPGDDSIVRLISPTRSTDTEATNDQQEPGHEQPVPEAGETDGEHNGAARDQDRASITDGSTSSSDGGGDTE